MPTCRKIIRIDQEKCDGCGQCAAACVEGAIAVVDGKARLVSEVYCDGLGACVGECPRGALTIEEREAPLFDEQAVKRHIAAQHHTCPGSVLKTFERAAPAATAPADEEPSRLGHWPVQLMLVPPNAPFLRGADLLVCADCVPFAVADFHRRYLDGRAVLVGCPKLDNIDYYRDKLAEVFAVAKPRRITVLRMEVPCCGALARAVVEARDEAAPEMPVEIHTIGIHGGVRRETSQGRA
jgi:Fe-S-cluster-containing hydrogenase component 2